MAAVIEKEAESWWDKGWVFLRAETDVLMESVCLFFEREIDPDHPPPDQELQCMLAGCVSDPSAHPRGLKPAGAGPAPRPALE